MERKCILRFSVKVKIISAIVLLAFLFFFAIIIGNRSEIYRTIILSNLIVGIIFILLLVFSCFIMVHFFIHAPISYTINERGLCLKKMIGSEWFLAEDYDIFENEIISFDGCVRVFGSGGYFGYTGKFRVPNKGVCTFYLTNEDEHVILLKHKETGRSIYLSK